jgi:hypothetical protein
MTTARPNLFGAKPAQTDSRIHICRACGKPGASCGIGDAWHCRACAPADFWPHSRGRGMTIAQLDLRRAHPNDPSRRPCAVTAGEHRRRAGAPGRRPLRQRRLPPRRRTWRADTSSSRSTAASGTPWRKDRQGRDRRADRPRGAQFASDAAFEELGGVAYLADLVDQAPPTSNAPSYAATIKATSRRRDLITLSQEVGKGAREAEEPEEVINYAEASSAGDAATTLAKADLCRHGRGAGAGSLGRTCGDRARHPDRACSPRRGARPAAAGNLVLFMGRPGMGKSAAAECVALNISARATASSRSTAR